MAPPKSFLIKLDNGDKPFFPGQSINGKVVLHCREKKKVRSIHLNLVGRAYVKWKEERTETTTGGGINDHTTSSRTVTVTFKAEESYFNFRVKLWGEEGRGSQRLEAGNYEFPFSLQLPSSPMPSSYESGFGNIRYWLEARLDRPWKFDHVTKFAFTLLERVDLNAYRDNLIRPLRFENQKTICCLCCQSGPVSLAVSIDRGGYCAGENILVTARVENNSNLAVGKLQAKLMCMVNYYARGETKYHEAEVGQMRVASIGSGQTFDWNHEPLPIPACPPTSSTCGIIHIKYVLRVTLVLPFAFNIVATFPITIGTVPFSSVNRTSTSPTIGFVRTQAANIADDQYTMGQTEFAPMYHFVQMPSQGQAENHPPPLNPAVVPSTLLAPGPPLPSAPVVPGPLPLHDQKVDEDLPPPYPGR
jgi:hypothetical protein